MYFTSKTIDIYVKKNLRENGKNYTVWVSSRVGQKSSATCRQLVLVNSQESLVCKPVYFFPFSRKRTHHTLTKAYEYGDTVLPLTTVDFLLDATKLP